MKTEEKTQTLDDIKAFFNQWTGKSVRLWNTIREEAKTKFPDKLISRLDASGFITEWLKG